MIDFNLPAAPRGSPRVPEALQGAILEILFEERIANFGGFQKMQSLQTKTLILEFPGDHLDAISKRLNDF